ncbi:unnamed protein product [Haemonchus placei]|uniref:CN hydrolase domain-containing protein n=1 Tax=Haemonchus placei TaxID=6290 RepID=A0A0N4WRK1_HAEPC|nr:unnamed protein product [Haemonchus placei]
MDVVAARQKEETTLLLLPEGFREIDTILKAQSQVERKVYWKLSEVIMWLDTAGANACILVGPTCAISPPKKEWCKLASAIATAARNGMKILLIAPPRGDAACAQNRMELNQAAELARKSVALMSRNIVSLIPMIESTCEPSHGPSAHPRHSNVDAYSAETVVEYL